MDKDLVQFDSGYFCAGAVFVDGKCVHAAPIIRWMVGKTKRQVWQGKVRGWKVQKVMIKG